MVGHGPGADDVRMAAMSNAFLVKSLAVATVAALLAGCGPVIDGGPDIDDPDSSTYVGPRQNAVPRPTASQPTTLNRPSGQRPTRAATRTFTPTKKPPFGHRVDIVRVIDGDTVELKDGRNVRVAGIDTPERGKPGYAEAKGRLQELVANSGGKVDLMLSQAKQDRYGRVIGYLDLDGTDAGLQLIKEGFAKARYDGLDGYTRHERQDAYRQADAVKNG